MKKNVPIISAVTAIDLHDQTILLRANEAIHLPENSNSLLSVTQVWEFGITVDDCAIHHKGTQRIFNAIHEIPLLFNKGLLSFKT